MLKARGTLGCSRTVPRPNLGRKRESQPGRLAWPRVAATGGSGAPAATAAMPKPWRRPFERAEAKRRGTRGWESALWQWLPVAWRAGGRRKAVNRPDGPGRDFVSRAAVGPACGRLQLR